MDVDVLVWLLSFSMWGGARIDHVICIKCYYKELLVKC